MKKIISILTLIAIPLGIVLGIYLPNLVNELSFIGTIYLNLLKFLVVPLVFFSIAYTFYKAISKKEKILAKSVALFIIMFIITFLLTSFIVYIINPTIDIDLSNFIWNDNSIDLTFSNIITNIFPNNIITPFQNNSLFTIILLAIFVGICATKVENGDKVMEVVLGLDNIFKKMLEYILYLNPIGALFLIANSVVTYKADIILMGLNYIIIAFVCSVIVLFLVMMLPVWIVNKINPIVYIKNCFKVWLMCITSCSSLATLPLTLKTCNDDFKIPKKSNLIITLGCAINFCGGAVSFAILGIFCSHMFGVDINFITFILMLFVALIINMAAPGIPSGGVVIGATYLALFNIPLDFIGFYSGLYKILDMAYTTLNVTGDITAGLLLTMEVKNV